MIDRGRFRREINAKYRFPQSRDHIQLLKKGIHIASAAKVFEPHVARSLLESDICIKFIVINELPRLFNLTMELVQNLESLCKIVFILLTKSEQERERTFSGLSIQLLICSFFIALGVVCVENEISDCCYQVEVVSCFVFQYRNHFEDGLTEQEVPTEKSFS